MEKNILVITCSSCGIRSRVKVYLADKEPVCQMCSFKIIDPDKGEAHLRFAESINKLFHSVDPENK